MKFFYCENCGEKLIQVDADQLEKGKIRLEIVCKNRVDKGKGTNGTRNCRHRNVIVLEKPLDDTKNAV